MVSIRNKETLVENGETPLNRKARAVALKSLEFAVNAVDPKKIIKSKLSLKNSVFNVNGHPFCLKKFRNIYVVGGGKASTSKAFSVPKVSILFANVKSI